MKFIPASIITCALLGAAACSSSSQQHREILLSDGWHVQSSAVASTDGTPLADTAAWYSASVPSTVMGVLTAAGVYPDDLLDGTNYKGIDTTPFDTAWWWQTSFALPDLAPDSHVTLDLDGISYRADVWLNGRQVASADTIAGTFRRHSIDITPFVGRDNTVAFKVFPAQPGEPNIGFVDWNPKAADRSMGIFRPVKVRVSGPVAITRPAVKSKVNKETLDEAWLTVEATVANTSDTPVEGTLRARIDGGRHKASARVKLAPGERRTVALTPDDNADLHIRNPRLWWVRNMGKPEMYSADITFDIDGKTSDARTVDFGIREVEDYFTADHHRGFLINGRPVLVRSAGWTDDIFLRNDTARNELEVKYVTDMGLNSIRFENIWGTSENIYDICDREGLLVFTGWSCQWEWPDYLGSPCDIYGGISSEEDMDLIARSLGDQVEWLRNHPSIIGWFVGSDMMPRPALERRYNDVLRDLDDRPVITAAKAKVSEISGPTGTKMRGPYEFVGPAYWYEPEALGGAFGWNTETGIGANIPQRESLVRMLGADSTWPLNDVWNYHCTTAAAAMNSTDTLTSVINRRLGGASDFADYVRKAEWINYEGTRTMFEAFRARVPEATGIVQWMLNSAWPSIYWQLYDHYLVPTSAYYSLRHSNAPVQLIYDYGRRAVVAVNETLEPATFSATMQRYDAGIGEPVTDTATVTVEPYTPVEVFSVPAARDLDFMFLTMTDADGREIDTNFYLLPHDSDIHDWAKTDWISTPVARHADHSALGRLPQVDIDASLVRTGDTVTVTLRNTSDSTVAFFNRLAAKDADGRLIVPAHWSDNYISLRPAETRTVTLTLPDADTDVNITLDGWNTPEKTL